MRHAELQPMTTWAEDRALLRSNPSADPGAKIGDGAAAGRSAPFISPLRDWHQREKPSRPEATIHQQDAALSLANAKRSEFQFTLNQDRNCGRVSLATTMRQSRCECSLTPICGN